MKIFTKITAFYDNLILSDDLKNQTFHHLKKNIDRFFQYLHTTAIVKSIVFVTALLKKIFYNLIKFKSIISRYLFFKLVFWIIWDFSGLRFILHKIIPPKINDINFKRPSTFILWVVSIYFALFGIATQRYEFRFNTLENRTLGIINILTENNYKKVLEKLVETQKLKCPVKPIFFNPSTIFDSLFGQSIKCDEIIDLVKSSVSIYKANLENIKLSGVILDGNIKNVSLKDYEYNDGLDNIFRDTFIESNFKNADLSGASFRYAFLDYSTFENAYLRYADFSYSSSENINFLNAKLRQTEFNNAFLVGSNFKNADLFLSSLKRAALRNANFEGAYMGGADLSMSDLENANFKNADLNQSNLLNVTNLKFTQLLIVKSLYGAILDKKIEEKILLIKPSLFKNKF